MNNGQKQEKYLDFMAPGGLVLELGSGGGDFLRICRDAGIKASGVEKDRKAACNKGFKVYNSDIKAFLKKEKAGKYMNVYARHIIEHFFPDDLRKLFRDARRILKKGGRFIAIFPNTNNLNVSMREFWKDETHARPYPGEAVIRMLLEAGFTVVKSGPDRDSWDDSALKNLGRALRGVLTGFRQEPPDYFIVAEK